MAIQPIDLQTLYTQMDKVSKTVVQQQQHAQLQGSMEIAGLVKKDMQKASSVEQTEKQESMSSIKDGKSTNENNQNSSKQKETQEQLPEIELEVIKDPSLGKNIDISG